MTIRILTLVAFFLSAPLIARAQHHMHDPDEAVEGGGHLPEGWAVQLDRASANLDQVRFTSEDEGLHITLGPAGIFYRPDQRAEGRYRVDATFTQLKAPRHPEAYGLFVGGARLDDADGRDYLYFLVRQTGEYLVKHRAGTEIHTLFDWTEHEAIHRADEAGRAQNELTIESGEKQVRFLVNGVEVAALDRVPMLNTDGIAGLRVNHNLDVRVTGFTIK